MIVELLRLMIRKSPPLVSLRKHFKGRPVQYQTFILGSLFGVRFCSKLHTQSWARSDWKGKIAEPFSLWFRVQLVLVLQNELFNTSRTGYVQGTNKTLVFALADGY